MNTTGGTATVTAGVGEQVPGHIGISKKKTTKAVEYKKLFETERLSEILTPEDYEKAVEVLDKIKNEKPKAYKAILSIIIDIQPHNFADIEDALRLNEGFKQFKQGVSKRSAPEQVELAVKEIKRKLTEVHRMIEYTVKLKTDISEGTEAVIMNKVSERALDEIKSIMKTNYAKLKKLN